MKKLIRWPIYDENPTLLVTSVLFNRHYSAPSGGLDKMENKSKLPKLNPAWVTGFSDAEGCFSVSILKSKTGAIGWTISPCFIITLHVKDLELLKAICEFFKVGAVSMSGEKIARYRVRSKEELRTIISHFKQYPLRTSKVISFAYVPPGVKF